LKIITTDDYKKSLKKLSKKYHVEYERLTNILSYIKRVKNCHDLNNNPIANTYGFERLKHELNEYHSFKLSKGRGGVIRLIVAIDFDNNILTLVFISHNHYEDFKRKVGV